MAFFRFIIFFIFIIGFVSSEIKNQGWWKNLVLYEVFVKSFMDSNGDGNGDLKGITNRLEHFADIGIGAIWMSPIHNSPMMDNGYDVSDFYSINPSFGSFDDFDELLRKAKELGIRVIIDFVPNHTSDQHEWFIKSVNGVEKYKDYYVWRRGRANNTKPPNNWFSYFHGSAWKYNEKRDLWYLHQFQSCQIDLNYTNPHVQQEMEDILKFWLDKGVNGFRIDAPFTIYEDERFLDQPRSYIPGVDKNDPHYLKHIYNYNDPRDLQLIQSWKNILDNWTDLHNEEERIIMTEGFEISYVYYDYGSKIPFNMHFIFYVNDTSKPSDFKNQIEKWMANVPQDGVANWLTNNHDNKRITTRYQKKPDLILMLAMILPGVACVYYGEEIAMEDNTNITWEETHDAMACSQNSQTYQAYTRDPSRTPFQWKNTTNADFSNAEKTWLPVNQNYMTLNLENQKREPHSPYNLFKTLSKLKSTSDTLKTGSLKTDVLNNDTVLVISRQSSAEGIVLLNNFSDDTQVVDASNYFPGSESVTVFVSSRGSNVMWGSAVFVSNIEIPPTASLLLVSTLKTFK